MLWLIVETFLINQQKKNSITYNNIQKITTGQENDYTTGCLLHYNDLNNYYNVITIDLSKQQAWNADPKSMQQINLPLSGLACDSIEQKNWYFATWVF